VNEDPPGDDPITLLTVDEFWNGRWSGPTDFAVTNGLFLPDPQPNQIPQGRHEHLPGTAFVGLADHHVHLGLVEPVRILAGGITDVDDLGWIPDVTQTWSADYRDDSWPFVVTSGGFITAPGGYPSLSGWAPRAASVEVSTPAEARQAVLRQYERDARQIKVTLNSIAGPVLDDELLAVITTTAHELGLPVVAHVEGAGQADRAWRAGIGILAHTPFSERLEDDLVRAMATRMTWISTFDIHGWGTPTAEFAVAIDNAQRFVAAGGRMLYGTDLGNGPLPLGVNRRELLALVSVGLSRDELVAAIGVTHESLSTVMPEFADVPLAAAIGSRLAFVPGSPPPTPAEAADWLVDARALDSRIPTEWSLT